ncbi:hypothetical protein M422DRAFT_52643 [Sphaerobolus stellatus SS14]|uniref:Unplaced genomic scaffold SPHSTscaffold_145, whole genome shotgun sequence n=1 Tax=Sphaerobolus stellatus (strain SS14) TaxID=990650 RepID=A0A0C9V5X5_SPHS4|nr:hypothetical protein M422DRAFT_52643 [Sphaerobolus stellatus SS14]
MKSLTQVRKQLQAASKRKGAPLTDPRAIKSMKIINGREIPWEEIPEELATPSSSTEAPPRRIRNPVVGGAASAWQWGFSDGDYDSCMGRDTMGVYDEGEFREEDNGNEEEPEPVSC